MAKSGSDKSERSKLIREGFDGDAESLSGANQREFRKMMGLL